MAARFPPPSPPVSRPTMATYTCITCRVAFDDAEGQRAHYKTDWHRYNLKRKVADMAPVTAEGFQERVRAQRAVAEPDGKGAATYCAVCGKRFACFNAYGNHLRSRRHEELERAAVRRRVALLNEKNLEKGLDGGADKDAVNAAIQQAVRAQPSPRKAPPAPEDRDAAEKPPRLQWLERQAKKLARQQGAEGRAGEAPDGDGGGGRGAGAGGAGPFTFPGRGPRTSVPLRSRGGPRGWGRGLVFARAISGLPGVTCPGNTPAGSSAHCGLGRGLRWGGGVAACHPGRMKGFLLSWEYGRVGPASPAPSSVGMLVRVLHGLGLMEAVRCGVQSGGLASVPPSSSSVITAC